MSFPLMDHDENICDIQKTVDKSINHYERYQSRFKNAVLADASRKNKAAHRTMGRPETAPPDPCRYLRRGVGLGGGAVRRPAQPATEEPRQRCLLAEGRRPPLPAMARRLAERAQTCVPRGDRHELTENHNNCTKSCEKVQNWKVHNILQVVNSKAKFPPTRYVDKEKGDAHDLQNSGLVPKYIYRKNYGKTPSYIKRYQRQRESAEEKYKQEQLMQKKKQQRNGYISQEEREEILQGLKHNRMELQEQFNKLPLLVDTISKANLKTMLEIQLRTLEKDILSIEENKYIYVYNGDHEYF